MAGIMRSMLVTAALGAAAVGAPLAVASAAPGSPAAPGSAGSLGSLGSAGAATSVTALHAGSSLGPGDSVRSSDGRYLLTDEPSGDLVLDWSDGGLYSLWHTGTAGHPGAKLRLQRDGNLVLAAGSKVLWTSGTSGAHSDRYVLTVQRNGQATLHNPSGRTIWATKTALRGVRLIRPSSPVIPGDGADPDVVYSGGVYYAFTSGTRLGNYLQALVDTTGTPTRGWHSYTGHDYGSSALPNPPRWETINTQTSPSVAHVGSHWVMWYDAAAYGYPEASGHSCLSVATASSLKPTKASFRDSSTRPYYCPAGGVLDPSVYVSPKTGTPYLIWKTNDGSSSEVSQVKGVRLNSAGTAFASQPVTLLTKNSNTFPWELTLDDPSLYAGPSGDILTFSGGTWNTSSYVMGYARCSGPLGPCYQPAGGPFLQTYGQAIGPGGGMVFAGAHGTSWLVFAAWKPGTVGQPYPYGIRRMFIAPIAFG